MNKQRYRIVFNQARGLLMAVAEYVSPKSKSRSGASAKRPLPFIANLSKLRFSILLAIGGAAVFPLSLQAGGIVADPSASISQQPHVTQAANGLPLINIQTPSAAGVSRNTYQQFDVSQQGAVLNNSRTNVQTQLGGWVQGNPYLGNGTAKVILNEVNSSNPSILNGFIEIAGTRAQLVIANPAGISCDGCGFINANRATLTTGTPIVNSGNLLGYRVGGGTISFLGRGMDASQSNHMDVIARAVEVNAGIWATQLNVVTGTNQVNTDSSGDVTSILPAVGPSGTTPAFAVDVAALGGMYAGKIHLVGTESGLGVRNAGLIGASAGEISVDVNGVLTNRTTGRIISHQDTQIQTNQDLANDGVIYAGGNALLTTQGDITNSNTIAAKGDVTVNANGSNSTISSSVNSVLAAGLNSDGTLGTGDLTSTATQSVTALGQNLAGQDLALSAQFLNLSGSQTVGRNLTFAATDGDFDATNTSITAGGTLSASATQTLITDGAEVSANQLNLAANTISNIAGELIQTGAGDTTIHLVGDLNNTYGRIAVNSSNLILGAQTVTNADGSIEHAGSGTLTINATTLNGTRGTLATNGQLDLNAQTATLDSGSTIATQINIDTVTLSNRAGEIIQSGTGNSTIITSTSFDNTAGTFATNGNTVLTLGKLINQGGSIQAAGTSDLSINASDLVDNTGTGLITAGGSIAINADQLSNTSGEIAAAQSLTAIVGQALDNSQGRLFANQDVTVTAASIENSLGTVASVQANLIGTAANGTINNESGYLQAAQNVTLASDGLSNVDGVINGVDVTLDNSTYALDNTRGSIAASSTLDSQSGQITNYAGLIQATGNIALNTQGHALINTNSGATGGIIGQSIITLTTGDLYNQNGFIGSKGDLTTNSAAIANTQAGVITSESTIALTGTTLDNRGGQIEASGNLTVNTGSGAVNNNGNNSTASLLRAGQTLTITAGSVTNANTLLPVQNRAQGLEGQSVAISADTLDNTNGAIRANVALTLTGHGVFNNTQGLISSGNSLKLFDSNSATKALAITNSSGTLIANTDLQINSLSLTGDGQVLSQGNLAVGLSSNYTQTSSGQLQANGNLSLMTTGNIANQSDILAGNTLILNAASIGNTATGEISGLDTLINVSGTLTNRGLINGSDTFITAATLNNIGTGSIFGDHLGIAANTLVNQAETVNNNTSAAVIAARDQLDIGAQTITNENGSLLFSGGDMAIGGSLDANHQATVAIGESPAAALINRNATIEALDDLNGNISNLQNLNGGITTQNVYVGSTAYHQFTPRGTSVVLNAADYPGAQIGNFNISTRTAGPYSFREYWRYVYTGYTTNTVVQTSLPGQLLSGGDMTLNGNITNKDSKIIAGGLLNVSGATLSNQNTQGQSTTSYSGTQYYYDYDGDESCGDAGDGCYDISSSSYNPGTSVSTFSLPTTQVVSLTAPVGTGTKIAVFTAANVSQTATGAGSSNVQISPIVTVPVVTTVVNTTTVNGQSVNSVVGTASPNTAFPSNSLFQTSPDPSRGYLIETNPRFANYKTWLSSDYMLDQLSYDPAAQIKRLGDGFFEQRLIREQVAMLTGKRFLTGYSSDEAQYQALMANGITFAKAFKLTPGIALSELQMAQLTTDIVWLVEQTITLPDGSTTQALVPQVYAKLQEGDLENTGALLASNSVNINLTGDLDNAGTIGSRNLMVLNADNINNLGGRISANDVALKAQRDINNLGGSITAQNSLMLDAEHNINVVSTTQSSQNQIGASFFSRTNLDRVAGLYVEGGQGLMVVSAGNDLRLNAAQVVNAAPDGSVGGQTILKAGNNLTLGTVQIAEQNNSVQNAKNYLKHGSTQDVGTVIQTEGDIALIAGNTLNAKATDITSNNGNIQGIAGRAINIESGEATSNMEAARYKKKSGTFSSKKTTTRDTFDDTTSIGGNLSAENITLMAGATIAGDGSVNTQQGRGKLNVIGSTVVATKDVNLSAGADINIAASQNTHDETHYKKVKQSGLTTSGASVTLGSSQLTNTNNSQQVINVGSTVGSIEGDVNINSGKTYTQTGSDMLAPAGDINISAQQVNITAATDTYNSQQTTKYKQSGITLAITNPIISAVQTAQQMNAAASETNDTRMKALAAGTAALAAKNAADALGRVDQYGNVPTTGNTGPNDMGNVREATAAERVGGVNVSISVGSSKSKSSTTQTSSSASISNVTAGGDVIITATGAGKISDINVVGSTIRASDDVTFRADDEINLVAAQNADTLKSKNKSSSASIGASFGTDGFLVSASAGSSKGKAKGNGTTWTETFIQSGSQVGDKVTLESGTDNNIIGSQVAGNQVIANVGTSGAGNLYIQSLQDTSDYRSKQQSQGGSITVGAGRWGGSLNMSDSKIKSDYASVNEQAGILAGDEGFQVSVAGNTNLTGAVLAATNQAIRDNKNSLSTETLTVSDIKNTAEYEGKSSSFGVGAGVNKQPDGSFKNAPTASAGVGSEEGEASSITVSGISGAVVSIDNASQQTHTGQDAATTIAMLNRDVHTSISTETDVEGNATTTYTALDSNGNNLANTLTPIFDKEKVERELQAAVTITQAFSQVAPKAVADFASSKSKDLLGQAQDADTAGDKAKAAQLRAEAKKWDEGGIYRVALHTALGGLITGDLSGALGAGAVASAAPLLNDLQVAVQETLENAGLGKENASVISQALAELASAGLGSAIGGAAGAGTALAIDTNNRQLHPNEAAFIKNKAKDYAAKRGISLAQAEEELARGALYANDADWQTAYQNFTPDEIAQYKEAASYLQAQAYAEGITFTNMEGRQQAAFTSTETQFNNEKYLLTQAFSDPITRSLYANSAAIAFNELGISSGFSFSKNAVTGFSSGVPEGMEDALKGYAALLDSNTYIKLVDAAQTLAADLPGTMNKLAAGLTGEAQEAAFGIYLDWLQKDSQDLGETSGKIFGNVVVDLAAAASGIKLVGMASDTAGDITKLIGRKVDAELDNIVTNALVKSGGVFDTKGNPLLDLKTLTNDQKRVAGELLGENTVKLIIPDGQKLARLQSTGTTGIDDLYKVNRSEVDYVVIEYKFVSDTTKTGVSRLDGTNDGMQGSTSWLLGSNRIEKAVGSEMEAAKVQDAIRNNKFEVWVVTTRSDGSTELEVVDALGKTKPIDASKILSQLSPKGH